MKKSKLFSLNLTDFWKGFIIAVLTAFLSVIYKTVEAGSLNFDVKFIATTTFIAALSYILKNLSENSKGEILKKDE